MKRWSILLQGSPITWNKGLYFYRCLLPHEKKSYITTGVSYHMKRSPILLQGSPTTSNEGLNYYRGLLPHETKVYITTGMSYHMERMSILLQGSPTTWNKGLYYYRTPKIHGMNCCEALNVLSFKWSSWNDALGPKQQAETINWW